MSSSKDILQCKSARGKKESTRTWKEKRKRKLLNNCSFLRQERFWTMTLMRWDIQEERGFDLKWTAGRLIFNFFSFLFFLFFLFSFFFFFSELTLDEISGFITQTTRAAHYMPITDINKPDTGLQGHIQIERNIQIGKKKKKKKNRRDLSWNEKNGDQLRNHLLQLHIFHWIFDHRKNLLKRDPALLSLFISFLFFFFLFFPIFHWFLSASKRHTTCKLWWILYICAENKWSCLPESRSQRATTDEGEQKNKKG